MALGWQTQEMPYENDGVSLTTSTTASSAGWDATTAVEVGRGDFWCQIVVTALGWAGSPRRGSGETMSPDWCFFDVEANSRSASTSWYIIGNLILGDEAATGRSSSVGVGTYNIGCKNDSDYQVRIRVYLRQSLASVTYSAKAFPISPVHA